jgi:hypothetical protein
MIGYQIILKIIPVYPPDMYADLQLLAPFLYGGLKTIGLSLLMITPHLYSTSPPPKFTE